VLRILFSQWANCAWRGSEDGATSVEYALIAGVMVLFIVGAVAILGHELSSMLLSVVPGFHHS